MTYVRITLYLRNRQKKSGIRHFEERWSIAEIQSQAWNQAIKALGRNAIEDVNVQEVAADDPAVVRFILKPKDQYSQQVGKEKNPGFKDRKPF